MSREWKPYRSFISMDMASKDHVNLVLDEPALENHSHAFTFHIVSFISVVERHVHENNEPRCLLPINPRQLFTEPFILWCVLYCYGRSKYIVGVLKERKQHFQKKTRYTSIKGSSWQVYVIDSEFFNQNGNNSQTISIFLRPTNIRM
jgi:hypothetical protein